MVTNQNYREKKSQTEYRVHRFVRVNITAKTMKRQKIQIRKINVWMSTEI